MNLNDIQFIFNRALELTLEKKKLFFTALVLFFCGVFVVFCRGVAVHANSWIALSLTFLPVFLCAGVLLATGIVLIRAYHDEVKKKGFQLSAILSKSWETIVAASYFSIPVILGYLLLWMLLGVFILLSTIPLVGPFFSVILAFAPFLLNLGTLILCVAVICMLFFLAPVVAFKGINRNLIAHVLQKRLKADVFSNILLFVIAALPLVISLGLLTLSAFLTGTVCVGCDDPLQNVLQWFFIMIPFTALLAPAVVFFFNFAAEAHVLVQKREREA